MLHEKNLEVSWRYNTLKNILERAKQVASEKDTHISASMIIESTEQELVNLNKLFKASNGDMCKKLELDYCIGVAKELLPNIKMKRM